MEKGKKENIYIYIYIYIYIKPDTIPACKHFNGKDHDFNRDAKFTLIEQIGNSKTTVEKQTIILQRENFWITTLRTLTPLGFKQELN